MLFALRAQCGRGRPRSQQIARPLPQAVLTYDLIEHFGEFINALPADDPTRRHQRTRREALARASFVRQGDLIGR